MASKSARRVGESRRYRAIERELLEPQDRVTRLATLCSPKRNPVEPSMIVSSAPRLPKAMTGRPQAFISSTVIRKSSRCGSSRARASRQPLVFADLTQERDIRARIRQRIHAVARHGQQASGRGDRKIDALQPRVARSRQLVLADASARCEAFGVSICGSTTMLSRRSCFAMRAAVMSLSATNTSPREADLGSNAGNQFWTYKVVEAHKLTEADVRTTRDLPYAGDARRGRSATQRKMIAGNQLRLAAGAADPRSTCRRARR